MLIAVLQSTIVRYKRKEKKNKGIFIQNERETPRRRIEIN